MEEPNGALVRMIYSNLDEGCRKEFLQTIFCKDMFKRRKYMLEGFCTLIIGFCHFFFIALDEARDINTHLKPLRKYIEEIEQTEIPELSLMLPSLMHLIGLIWGSSSYYCSPQKIVVLLQEIGNLLVAQVCSEP